jgi:hypothetical protein
VVLRPGSQETGETLRATCSDVYEAWVMEVPVPKYVLVMD